MREIKWLISAVFVTLVTSLTWSQDVVFSQHAFAPIYLNPAHTGEMEQSFRLQTVYRNQFESVLEDASYRTFNGFVDSKITLNEKLELGIGGSFFRDKAGSLNLISRKFSTSISMIYYFTKGDQRRNKLSIGADIGQGINTIESESIINPIKEKVKFLDLSVGALWSYISSENLETHVGVSLLHVNEPNISFFEGSEYLLPYRTNVEISLLVPIMSKWRLGPTIIYVEQMNRSIAILRLGNELTFKKINSKLSVGVFSRVAELLDNNGEFASYGCDLRWWYKGIIVGMAYDRFIDLETNGYEFSLGYLFGK